MWQAEGQITEGWAWQGQLKQGGGRKPKGTLAFGVKEVQATEQQQQQSRAVVDNVENDKLPTIIIEHLFRFIPCVCKQ